MACSRWSLHGRWLLPVTLVPPDKRISDAIIRRIGRHHRQRVLRIVLRHGTAQRTPRSRLRTITHNQRCSDLIRHRCTTPEPTTQRITAATQNTGIGLSDRTALRVTPAGADRIPATIYRPPVQVVGTAGRGQGQRRQHDEHNQQNTTTTDHCGVLQSATAGRFVGAFGAATGRLFPNVSERAGPQSWCVWPDLSGSGTVRVRDVFPAHRSGAKRSDREVLAGLFRCSGRAGHGTATRYHHDVPA